MWIPLKRILFIVRTLSQINTNLVLLQNKENQVLITQIHKYVYVHVRMWISLKLT